MHLLFIKLKAYFQETSRGLGVYLRDVAKYLLNQMTQEASKGVKPARAAMGNNNTNRCKRFKNKLKKKSRDPLRTFSSEALRRRPPKGGIKRKGPEGNAGHNHKRKQSAE